jgi:hypothetical protein
VATTRIAGREVPIQPGEIVTVCFSAGRAGEAERGRWEFWTVVRGKKGLTARCRPGADPGERFRREKGSEATGFLSTVDGIRPSQIQEVIAWLNDPAKKGDASFALCCHLGGRTMTVTKAKGTVGFD